MKTKIRRLFLIFVIPFFAGIFLINISLIKHINAGGPTATLSHTNDRPDSYAMCAGHTSDVHSVGVMSTGLWMPQVTTESDWITVLNTEPTRGIGFVQYRVAKNFTPYIRAGVITIGNQTFTILQDPYDETKPCPIETNPAEVRLSNSGGNVPLEMDDHGLNQDWQIEGNSAEWLLLGQPTGRGSGATSFEILLNYSGEPRMTTVKVAGKIIPIIQGGSSR